MNPLQLLKNITSFFASRKQRFAVSEQDAFRTHYKTFRALLTANNTALELMAGLEQAIPSGRPFGMAFLRGHCTALTVNIFKMIRALQQLSGGRYEQLTERYKAISAQLELILAIRPKTPDVPLVLPLSTIDRNLADAVGEKMANLGEVRNRVGLVVPDGFVMTAVATQTFMRASGLQDEIRRRLRTMDTTDLEDLYTTSAAIQKLITAAPLPLELDAQIQKEFKALAERLGAQPLMAVRSSAVGEDSGGASFAGQYRTQLNVTEDLLGATYKEIVASKYRSQAIVYRQQRGFRHQDVTMCVGCLEMIDAVVSGVTYSRAPDNPRSPFVVINASPGLAAQVVDGRTRTDLLEIGREPPHPILRLMPRSSESTPSLDEPQAAELARIAVRLEDHFGTPQDIEWSIDRRGRIIILQSRPLGCAAGTTDTTPGASPAPVQMPPGALLAGGVTASAGAGCGPAHVVRTSVDMLQFPQGAVLVVSHPLPEWATLMNRAVALLSETGQVAAHLATVAREFGIPALFGVEGATTRLATGRTITVDATGRAVFPERRDDLLAQEKPKNLMLGSPIAKLLEQALVHITPLNLTDPASPFFRPSSCETFHDLTRFCHEKAVAEMFSFGARCGFDAKSAKQLVSDAPSQWWIINLEDGFVPGHDPKSPFVNLSEIVSTPMLAIWGGMTAIPWPGPPPVSVRGFGSILFQSTMNPSLDPGVRSSMAGRNYFLVARNFCNLSVRLGYHFALAEAYLSELLTESYVSFKFKGGAADERRRLLRIELIADILAQHDFRVEQKGDSVTARIEKKPIPYLEERLRVLGYLLIHTRQIDMVMGDAARLDSYRTKIATDLERILAHPANDDKEST